MKKRKLDERIESKKKTLGGTEKKILIVSSIAVLLTLIIGASYAYIAYTTRQKGINVLETDCINVTMEELTNEIRLTNAYPVTDEVGSQTKPFRFKLENTCGVGVDYNLNLEVMETENRIAAKNIAVKIDENTKSILSSNQAATPTYKESDYRAVESYTTYSGRIRPYESVTHEVRIWLDESAGNDSQNGSFYSKVVIEAKQSQMAEYKEEILNGADPVLAEGLVPVEIDETGKVTKANLASEWYNYGEKRWANAVILTGEDTYKYKEEIPESAIESYFVWIPKYSYKIQTLETSATGQEKPFEIKFGLTNTSDSNTNECATPGTSGESGNCQVGDYMTHPAFISMRTNGLWVGKFETGYKGATTTGEAQVNANDSSKVQIKPNVYSWRSITVSNMFKTSYDYKRKMDSHMMKNTEWGAVAYLYHSIYGRCNGTTCEEIYANNNSDYITGWSATSVSEGSSTTSGYEYSNVNSVKASTTGNYSGIYDMNGGAWLNVAGVRGSLIANSEAGFTENDINTYSAKYYDIYSVSNDDAKNYTTRILGDATAEVNNWYDAITYFVYSNDSWFYRTGWYGTTLFKTFAFTHNRGPAWVNYGFRIVLAI